MLFKILTVAGLATFEIYAAIPAGFAFKLSAWTIFFASLTGGIVGVYVAAFLGDKIRAVISKYKKPKEEKPKNGLIYRIWDKYGVIGLGFLGTVTVGAPISIAVGYSFNVSAIKLITWCCIGVLTRCVVFTVVGHYGLKLFGN
jgi:membrane protein YqaA with SNARE-associated domain